MMIAMPCNGFGEQVCWGNGCHASTEFTADDYYCPILSKHPNTTFSFLYCISLLYLFCIFICINLFHQETMTIGYKYDSTGSNTITKTFLRKLRPPNTLSLLRFRIQNSSICICLCICICIVKLLYIFGAIQCAEKPIWANLSICICIFIGVSVFVL